ncbi:MAG: efflux RND transporter periplasmic adaptor subunit [Alphaproteobacteria bacterium]|nr:MAG: efflux RND transporter periplasmic adaptor subunit [Alphaproteobacteria bacterium]
MIDVVRSDQQGAAMRPGPKLNMVQPEPMLQPAPPPRRWGGWRWLLLAVLGAAALFGWRYAVPVQADAVLVQAAPFTRMVTGPALLDALVKVDVGARVAGRIADLKVEEGDHVAAGALLVSLDAGDAGHFLTQAQAQAAAARSAVTEAEAERDAAEAALLRAQADFRRREELLQRGIASRADFDAARSTLNQAVANAERTRTAVLRSRDQLGAAEAGALGTGVRLSDTVIGAPISGVVTDRLRNVGEVVSAGSPILRLVDPASLVLTARFDESVMAQIAPGQPAELRYTSYPGRVFRGTVLRLGRSVDTTTREFSVDVALAEPPPHWAIGQRAIVSLATSTASAVIAVPQDALAPRGGQAGLWVAEGGYRAHWRPVQLGSTADGRIEVSAGLREGEVVLRRPRGLYTFKPVTPVMS